MHPLIVHGRPLRFLPHVRAGCGGIRKYIAALALLLTGLLPHAAAAQSAADSSLALMWTSPGDDGSTGTAATYAIRYRTTPIVGTDTLSWWNAATPVTGLPTPRAAGSIDSVRVRGLNPVTTYFFILRTADEVPNWSGFSNFAQVSTSGDLTPPAAIADLFVTGTTGTSVSVRWTAPGNNGTTGTAASYDVRYSLNPITAANFAAATAATGEPAPAVAGTVQNFTINGLLGSRTYFVAMKTTDAAGNVSVISNVVSGATLDNIAPAAVVDLSARP